MKIMVCLKQVPHQDARLDIRSDGTWIQEDNIKFEINSYDTYALEEALRIKDSGEAEVVVDGIEVRDGKAAFFGAIGLGVANAFIRPLLVMLTLPITYLTLGLFGICLLYTSPSPRDVEESRMPSSA